MSIEPDSKRLRVDEIPNDDNIQYRAGAVEMRNMVVAVHPGLRAPDDRVLVDTILGISQARRDELLWKVLAGAPGAKTFARSLLVSEFNTTAGHELFGPDQDHELGLGDDNDVLDVKAEEFVEKKDEKNDEDEEDNETICDECEDYYSRRENDETCCGFHPGELEVCFDLEVWADTDPEVHEVGGDEFDGAGALWTCCNRYGDEIQACRTKKHNSNRQSASEYYDILSWEICSRCDEDYLVGKEDECAKPKRNGEAGRHLPRRKPRDRSFFVKTDAQLKLYKTRYACPNC